MNFKDPIRTKWSLFLLIALAVSGLLLAQLTAVQAQEPATPEQVITEAWELAQDSGRYQFRTQVEQTTYPQPRISNAGLQPSVQNMGLEGAVDLTVETLNLTLWGDLSFNPDTGIEIRVEDGVTYARKGQGEWQEADSMTDLIAPGGDPMSFLAGVKNVTAGESRVVELAGTTIEGDQYLFDLNGPAFAEHMRAEMAQQLRERGKLPPGIQLSASDAYKRMTGSGELWLNEAGLPIYLVFNVDFPALGEEERVTAVITNNIFNYDLEQLAAAGTPFLQSPTSWTAVHVTAEKAVPTFAFGLFLVSAVLLIKTYWRSKNFYRLIAIFITLSMLFSPLLQSEHVSAFFEEQNAQEQAAKAQQAEADANDFVEQSGQTTNWQPNLNAGSQLQANIPTTFERSVGVDTDGDGISDDDEINIWQTDPNNADSDGDGLDDGLEAFTTGTAPAHADTDGDKINDDLEMTGFFYNNETWYLNPLENDSNLDGLSDGKECPRWMDGTTLYNPATICPDTDGNGTPDVFDDDNDGDGVVDKFDLNPNSHGGQLFSGDNLFEWRLENLETDRTVFLDFQMRPSNPNNLALHGNILDWPTGDTEGQITRYEASTFADTANLDIRSTAANAANGDIRLTPVLEIVIPGADGHFGNLPVVPAYSGSPRPANLPADDWLDMSRLAPYNVTAGDTGDTADPYRDLVVYVPVSVQTDSDSGLPVAFGARMPYFPEQGTTADPAVVEWGSSHQARLVWLVQMITDQCVTEGEEPETCQREDVLQVIHVYDETWSLTGLSVSEEQGMDVGIVYEDPALDPSFETDDQLWAAANSLNSTFLRGRDIDTNDIRDVRVDNLAAEMPTWHNPANGPYYLGFQPLINTYSDSDQVHQVMMTETVALLNTVFAGYESQTDPTLLFVRETTNRLVTLDMMTASGNSFTGDFDPTAVFPTTTADMSWKPYDYVSGGWTNADPETYLQNLEANLTELVFVEPADATQQEIDAVEGQRLWAQMYYAALYQGIGNLVESNGEVVWLTNATVDESFYEPAWPNTTFAGAAYISTFFTFALGRALIVTISNAANIVKFSQPGTTFWSAFKASLSKDSTAVFGRNQLFPPGSQNPTGSSFATALVDMTTFLIVMVSVAGLYYFAYGYFTGDQSALKMGTIILNAVTLAVSLGHLALVSYTLFKLLTLAGPAAAGLQGLAAAARYQTFLKGSQAYGAIGFTIAVVVAWGMFLYQWLSGEFGGSQIARNFNIAASIAATAIAITLLLIDVVLKLVATAAVAAVGTIFVLLLVIIDVILYFSGEKTLTQRLTEEIARATYDVDFILSNFNAPERLTFNLSNVILADMERGFTLGNSFYPAFTITNTIHFRKQSNNSEARRSAFTYTVQQGENDQHGGLNGNSMRSDWMEIDGRKLRYTTTITAAFPLTFTRTGVNRPVDGFVLSEAFAIPYQGCWSVFGAETNACDWEYIKGSNHIDLTNEILFDVLPATVSAFSAVTAWGSGSDLPFPAQTDQDNDGLLSQAQGGPDPNDKEVDTDGDGLSDAVELAIGTDPQNPDSDGDGLTDGEEVTRWLTDPNNPDTDGDGLDDRIEMVVGWLTPVGNSGQVMRVWSNPLYADLDGDGLDDFQEFAFGFHPLVPTDPAAIANLVQIDKMQVDEPLAPIMRLDFDETGSSFYPGEITSFGGAESAVTCSSTAGSCPLSGVDGRYSNAVQFDGINDVLTSPPITDLDMHQNSFSIGLWLKSSTPPDNMALFARHDGDNDWETGEELLFLTPNGDILFYSINGANFNSGPTSVLDGNWHHVMAVWDFDEASGQGKAAVYLDGVDVTIWQSTGSPAPEDGSEHQIDIGNFSFYDPYQGEMDDFMLVPYALTAEQVTDAMMGRIQRNDQIVGPGDPLQYTAAITNSLLSQGANGFMIGTTEWLTPAIPTPEIVLHFDEDERIEQTLPDIGSVSWNCIDNGTCPLNDFDGIDDVRYMPTVNVREEGDISYFWDDFNFTIYLRLHTLPDPGEVMAVFDTAVDEPGALDIYVDSDGWIWFDVQDTILAGSNVLAAPYGDGPAQQAFYDSMVGQHVAHGIPVYTGGQHLGQLVKYTFEYSQLEQAQNEFYNTSAVYVDYDDIPAQLHLLEYEFQGGAEEDGLRLGPGTIGSEAGPETLTNVTLPIVPLDARIDWFAAYNGYATTHAFLDHMHNGRWRGYNFDLDLYPSTLVDFDRSWKTRWIYPNDVNDVLLAYCGPFINVGNQEFCPATDAAGVFGEGAFFAGQDDLTVGPVEFPQGDYTISTWFKSSHNSEQYLLAALDPDNSDEPGLALSLTGAGEVTFDHNFPTTGAFTVTTQSGGGYNDGGWYHVAIVREATQLTLYLDGQAVDAVSGGKVADISPNLVIGRLKDTTSLTYNGSLDELVILPFAVAEESRLMLMNSTWPAITTDYDFIPFHVDAASSTVVNGTAGVNPFALNSSHIFEQEVEAALELQTAINIPIVDPASGSLQIFAPFEDVPGSTQFENIAGTNEFICPIPDACPTAGLRGIGDRAAFFDGEDDYLINNTTTQLLSFAAWVKADDGSIFDTRQSSAFTGVELSMDQLRIQVKTGGGTTTNPQPDDQAGGFGLKELNLDLPENEWSHVVVTLNNNTGIATLYVNGVQAGTLNYGVSHDPYTGRPTLGGNLKGGNYLHGYLADFRAYNLVLSPAQVTTLYQNYAPVLRLEFDETAEDTFFTDISQNGFIGNPTVTSSFDPTISQTVTLLNPTPGTDGKIGNTGLFLPGGKLEINPADDSPFDLHEMTIMLWVNPEQEASNFQNLISKHSPGADERNYQLNIPSNSTNVRFTAMDSSCSSFITSLVSNSELPTNQWSHVALTFDGNSAKIFLNGQLDNSRNYPGVSLCQNDHSLKIGGGFTGQLDELAVYGRAMSEAELFSFYERELRWYRARGASLLRVDNDTPSVALATPYPYRPLGHTQLVVTTFDASSAVVLLDVGIKGPNDSEFTWRGTVECEESQGGAAWCPSFDSTASGPGLYEIQFRAVDAVGHETVSSVYQIIVDDAPPVVGSVYSGELVPAVPAPDIDLTWVITLTGTITDPLVGSLSGSGTVTDSIMVSLVDNRGETLDGSAQTAVMTGADSWQIGYVSSGTAPSGYYTLTVRAEDKVGNGVDTAVGTLRLDAQAAQADVNYWQLPGGVISQSLTLSGTVVEQPFSGGTLARYHFEEAPGATPFYDNHIEQEHAACTNCPSSTAGVFGQGLLFDGVDDTVNVPNLFNPISDTFSISLWFYADGSGFGQRLLVQQDDGSGQGRSLIYLTAANKLASNLGGFFAGGTAVSPNTWHHAAFTFDGTTGRLYLDGKLDGSADLIPEAADGGLQLGSNRGGSAFFPGMLDEVSFYGEALSDYAVYSLAQTDGYGVGDVNVGFELVDFAALTDTVTTTLGFGSLTTNWYTAAVANPGQPFSTWTLTNNEPLENFYTIKLRSSDAGGNQSGSGTIWRGLIDRVAPVVSASGQHIGGGSAAQTEYTVTFSDFLLDGESFVQPCQDAALTSQRYDDSILPHDGLPYEVTATCRVPGHEVSRTFTACDAAGHCTDETVTLDPSPQLSSVAILTPTHQAVISSSGVSITIPVGGGAYDLDGIETIAVDVNGQLLDTLSLGGATDTYWSAADWQPTQNGAYTLTAVMTDSLNTVFTDSIQVQLELRRCLVEYDGDDITDFASADGSAVQTAVTTAPDGSTIKIAGFCQGVQTDISEFYTPTVYITKSLTIEGGYDFSESWLTADPDNYPTILDAGLAGRVVVIETSGTVTLTNLTLENGRTQFSGGGLLISNSTVTANNLNIVNNIAAANGGGVSNSGTLILRNSIVTNNQSGGRGGGIYSSNGTYLTVEGSRVNDNIALTDGGGIHSFADETFVDGSIIYGNEADAGGGIYHTNILHLLNSTVSGNEALTGAGGIFSFDTIHITHTTVVSNVAPTIGGILVGNGDTSSISSSIVAYHSTGDCLFGTGNPDKGYNIFGDGSCSAVEPTSLDNTDPMLAPLADNPGPAGSSPAALTHALLPGSPALDAVPNGTSGCGTTITIDQRGEVRPFNVNCDIGAHEMAFTILAGDTTCDATRNVIDALYIMQYEVGLRTAANTCPLEPDTLFLPACDVNGDSVCNVIDALYIMQCEVGIANPLCPTAVPSESQVEGLLGEEAASITEEGAAETAESDSIIRPSNRVTTIQIPNGSVAVGETTAVPVRVNVPLHSGLTAVTLDITFDPAVVSFNGCAANEAAFNLSLCALQDDGRTVTITALAVSGFNGETLLAELTFTGRHRGTSALTLTSRAFEDGSGQEPRLRSGRLTVKNTGGTVETEKEISVSGKVVGTVTTTIKSGGPSAAGPDAAVPSTITIGSGTVGEGETITVPITIEVPLTNNLEAVTLRIQYDPTVLMFDSCTTNNDDFDFNLCNLSEGDGVPPDIVSFSAVSAFGVNGTLELGTITFTGSNPGTSSLTVIAETYEDGSGEAPVVVNGTIEVGEATAVQASSYAAAALSNGGTGVLLSALVLLMLIATGYLFPGRRRDSRLSSRK